MTKPQSTLWGIHAGETGDADQLFMKQNVIAIGWPDFGDAGKIEGDRDTFKAHMRGAYPGRKDGYYPNTAGQIFRFVHEIKPGDYVVYPAKYTRQVHIGKITGDYKYNGANEDAYPQQRPVQWLKQLPRTHFSQGALYEIGSALSLFQIRQYADEFFAALEGQPAAQPPKEDESVSLVASDIEQTARDYILKTLATELKGHGLAHFVGHLLNTMGYRTRVSPEGPDGGIDIIAHKDELGFEPPLIKVQVKSSDSSVGDPAVSQLNGKVDRTEFGIFVCLGTFTNQAKAFARNKSNLRLIDGDELVNLILEHYDQFDARYKALMPLKRVYVPEPPEEN